MRNIVLIASILASGTAVQAQDLPEGWTPGPTIGQLGTTASISIPDGYFFLNRQATRRFLEQNQNIPSGDEVGIILRLRDNEDYWFAVFTYADTGHIDDNDKSELDADTLMKNMLEGNRQGNEERRQRGWSPLTLDGWHQRPYYDLTTNNLTWSTKLSSEGQPVINHSVRLLGRTGLMSVQLVDGFESIDAATSEFNDVLGSYAFNAGQRYAEFRQGDKIAGYGLTALVAGGAAAAAVKTGFLQKFWKALVLGLVALAGALKRFLKGLFGGRADGAQSESGQAPVNVATGFDGR